jgi:hypothetical protein
MRTRELKSFIAKNLSCLEPDQDRDSTIVARAPLSGKEVVGSSRFGAGCCGKQNRHEHVDMIAFTEADATGLLETLRGLVRITVVVSNADVYRPR